MVKLKSIRIALSAEGSNQLKQGVECYLILQIDQLQSFTKTAPLHKNVFRWELAHELPGIYLTARNNSLRLQLLHYDTCQEVVDFELNCGEYIVGTGNKTYEQNFTDRRLQAGVFLEFEEAQGQEQDQVDKVNSYDRFSKKTKTTHYDEQVIPPSLEKVTSLRQIRQKAIRGLIHSPRACYAGSPVHSPHTNAETAYLRSFRTNIQKKLFASIELQSKTKQSYFL